MLGPWLEVAGARAVIDEFSEAAGLDLARLGSTADAEEIRDTAVTQPLIVATTLLAYRLAGTRLPAAAPVAGHSVGEIAAAAIAGVLSASDAVAFAAARGAEMAAACALHPTGMSAVLGGAESEVLAGLDELGLTAANRNGAKQIVAAGPLTTLETLAENPPGRARVTALKVAGAFHTEYMAPAKEALGSRVAGMAVSDPTRPLCSNADGALVTSGQEFLHRLVEAVTRPVRWDVCMATLAELGVHASVELPPAGTLTGLVKRELRLETVTLKTPEGFDELDRALASGPDQEGGAEG
jgi:[acyl-carrier-protein] S-malonyltransferase